MSEAFEKHMDASLASLELILITFRDCVSSAILGNQFFLGNNSYGSSDGPAGVWFGCRLRLLFRASFLFSARDRTAESACLHMDDCEKSKDVRNCTSDLYRRLHCRLRRVCLPKMARADKESQPRLATRPARLGRGQIRRLKSNHDL